MSLFLLEIVPICEVLKGPHVVQAHSSANIISQRITLTIIIHGSNWYDFFFPFAKALENNPAKISLHLSNPNPDKLDLKSNFRSPPPFIVHLLHNPIALVDTSNAPPFSALHRVARPSAPSSVPG
jgi:hypothetical protein